MKKFLLLSLLTISTLNSQDRYFSNHDCKECHEKIYEEYQSSAHSRGYFNDELHRKIADSVSQKEYKCAVCHMPMADNLKDLMSGEARPNPKNKTHSDAISCYFCHTIAYVKKAHEYNINTPARQAENYKPTLYGRLNNPDESDKHSSSQNPIYGKKVCMGCHSHKLNEHNVTIFRAMSEKQDSMECIKCHMPEVAGGAEKMDKRSRGQHANHKFLGVHDKEFRAKGVDINISTSSDTITIKLTNKMAHPLIIQPARVKYLVVQVLRNGKEIWRNYKGDPKEDREAFFELRFYDKAGKRVVIPAKAHSSDSTNLDAHKSKTLTYSGLKLQKGDIVEVTMYVRFAKRDCQTVIKLNKGEFTTPFILKRVQKSLD